uniref:Putative secreted protein n=1 Tax=Anopheles darlingi TaxID=43151 RepID=A0A2M4CZX2_ANODA
MPDQSVFQCNCATLFLLLFAISWSASVPIQGVIHDALRNGPMHQGYFSGFAFELILSRLSVIDQSIMQLRTDVRTLQERDQRIADNITRLEQRLDNVETRLNESNAIGLQITDQQNRINSLSADLLAISNRQDQAESAIGSFSQRHHGRPHHVHHGRRGHNG